MPRVATALVVDPDPENAAKLIAMLTGLSLVVDHVRSGGAAVSAIERHHYRLVVTELSLSGVDGFAFIKRLRAHNSSTRVVVVSGFMAMRTAAMQQRTALGIDAVIARHGGADTLLRTFRRALETLSSSSTSTSPSSTPTSTSSSKAPPPSLTPSSSPSAPAPAPAPSPVAVAAEKARLVAVGKVHSAPTGADAELRQIVDDAARVFGVGATLVNFVNADVVTIVAGAGDGAAALQRRGHSRDGSFCRHVVEADVPAPLVVPDAALHPLFAHNPLVTDGTIRSYVGTPLLTSSGQCLGTLCLIDNKPSRLGERDVERLRIYARQVSGHLELKAAVRRHKEREDAVSKAEAELIDDRQRIQSRWTAVFDALDLGVLLMSGPERTVRFANATIGEVFGVDEGALVGLSRDQTLRVLGESTADANAFVESLAAPAIGPFAVSAVVSVERPNHRVLRWSGKPVIIDNVPFQLATFTDITAEAALIAHNEITSSTDPLTGLLNRRGFDAAVARELARQARGGVGGFAVIALDIDHFKKRNDTYGHAKGDEALVAVASAIAGAARAVDVVARIGGEEFVVVAVDVTLDAAAVIAERIRAAVAGLVLDTGPISVSAGVAPVVGDGEVVSRDDVDHALIAADTALYQAKRQGRDRVVRHQTPRL